MASGNLKCPENAQNYIKGLQSTIFNYIVKHRFIYLLIYILSRGTVRLHIMCVETIAGGVNRIPWTFAVPDS